MYWGAGNYAKSVLFFSLRHIKKKTQSIVPRPSNLDLREVRNLRTFSSFRSKTTIRVSDTVIIGDFFATNFSLRQIFRTNKSSERCYDARGKSINAERKISTTIDVSGGGGGEMLLKPMNPFLGSLNKYWYLLLLSTINYTYKVWFIYIVYFFSWHGGLERRIQLYLNNKVLFVTMLLVYFRGRRYPCRVWCAVCG